MFFPDWIIKTTEGTIWIIDTKKGITSVSSSTNTREKMMALNEWLAKNKKFKGGIVEPRANEWYLIESIDNNGIVKQKRLEF
jgi:hypothetical protein